MFSRIAVVNRGEPAVRLIRAVRELDAEHGTATRVGSVHDIIPAAELRPCLIAAVERGMERALRS